MAKVFTKQGVFELENNSSNQPLSLEEVKKQLGLVFPKLDPANKEKIKKLVELTQLPTPTIYYFQDKLSLVGLEILAYKNQEDYELTAIGTMEKVLPLIKEIEMREEIPRVCASWSKEKLTCFVLATTDFDHKIFDLFPAHYESRLDFVALLGLPN